MSFTTDWFNSNIPIWKRYLNKLKSKPLTFLELGTFEGRSAIWVLENILTHPDSRLYVVDHWKFVGDHNKNPYKTFLQNIKPYKNKVVICKGYTKVMLRKFQKIEFDFIYIDANRHSQNVLEDAVLSFPLLKPNGLLIFDDYTNNKEHDINCPKPGIDAFLNTYANEIKVLYTKWQVVIKKREKLLPRRPCYSEFYTDPKKPSAIYKDINKFR
jgi:predicted O-methyltransferase YrrM